HGDRRAILGRVRHLLDGVIAEVDLRLDLLPELRLAGLEVDPIDAGRHRDRLETVKQLFAVPRTAQTGHRAERGQLNFLPWLAVTIKEPEARGCLVHVLPDQGIADCGNTL